ncbi:DUF4129 domain-containing transglutaminase family protein [Dehalogenimonas sp. 4OHTPN]|uniref:DUF4129 domain-containing transglutaminase family protein n=1 Tax=Dehalogenimonas sp. 4OHTPN TaxID=3166643 RepID=A0AAU8G8I2_9CHLR
MNAPSATPSRIASLAVLLTLAALGVAVRALEAAQWVSPQPSLVLVLALGLGSGALLAASRLKGSLALLLLLAAGSALAAWQSAALFPADGDQSAWSRWLEAVSRPTESQAAFVTFLSAVSYFSGAAGAWFVIRRRNGWPAFTAGALVVVLNLTNLPPSFDFVLPLYLTLGLILLVETGWRRLVITRDRQRARLLVGLPLCLAIVAGTFILPQTPAEKLKLDLELDAVYSSIKRNTLNIFQAVPSKVKTVRASAQEAVVFKAQPELSETVRFTINLAQPGYFRTRYYDVYSASGWSNSPLSEGVIGSGQTIADAVPLARSVVIKYRVENQVKTDLILLNGQPSSLSIPAASRWLPAAGNSDIMALVSPRLLPAYQSYEVTARLPQVTAAELAGAGGDYPEWITNRYLQLPNNLPPSVRLLSRQLTYGRETAYAKVQAVKDYLSRLGYNVDGADVVDGADGVAFFLSAKTGNCVNFASALVVLLREAGVPARFCQGYLGTELDESGKSLVIRGRDAHAWAEVYFPGFGWIMVEATPGRPADGFEADAPIIPNQALPPGEVFPSNPGSQADDILPTDVENSDAGDLGSSLPPLLITVLLLAGVVLAGGAGGIFYLSRANDPGGAYRRLAIIGKLFRLPPCPADTPLEFARRLSARLPSETVGIDSVAGSYSRLRYGPARTRSEQDDDGLRHQWRQLSLRLIRYRLRLASPETNRRA